MNVIFTKGLPASGKSTWAKEFCSKNTNWVRVNRDDLRNMRGKYWLPKDEGFITKLEVNFILTALGSGKDVIVDATNLNAKYLSTTKHTIRLEFPKVKITERSFLDVSLKTCLDRDAIRANSVGKAVIQGMYDKYLLKRDLYVADKSKQDAYIFDIDGTIAEMVSRGPFDWDKVDKDKVNEDVAEVLNRLCDS